tara:strand:+ start:910 stop:1149 length:240 start_codon:yes stop_codon:yes gene_type:complete
MDPLHSLLRESLNQSPIGQSKNFKWFITDVGIIALINGDNKNINSLDPIKEAIELDLDLSKEEKELIKLDEKQILLFYS